MLLSCDFCFCQTPTHTHTPTPLPFSCCSCCCCCSCCRCHCRCPCAYCATMHNALGFLSAFLCLKLSATLTLCTHWERLTGERDAQRAFYCCRATKDLIQRSLTQGHDPLPTPSSPFPLSNSTNRLYYTALSCCCCCCHIQRKWRQQSVQKSTPYSPSTQHVPAMESTFHDVQKG